jgi:hypothetical protein
MMPVLIPLLVISLAFTVYALWRWRPRAYLVRGPIQPPRPWPDPPVKVLLEPCLSCGQSKPPDAACPHCGFCGMVFADPQNFFDFSPQSGRLVSEGTPARANEAKDSSRREAAS